MWSHSVVYILHDHCRSFPLREEWDRYLSHVYVFKLNAPSLVLLFFFLLILLSLSILLIVFILLHSCVVFFLCSWSGLSHLWSACFYPWECRGLKEVDAWVITCRGIWIEGISEGLGWHITSSHITFVFLALRKTGLVARKWYFIHFFQYK